VYTYEKDSRGLGVADGSYWQKLKRVKDEQPENDNSTDKQEQTCTLRCWGNSAWYPPSPTNLRPPSGVISHVHHFSWNYVACVAKVLQTYHYRWAKVFKMFQKNCCCLLLNTAPSIDMDYFATNLHVDNMKYLITHLIMHTN